jgi:DNA repair photolyase
VNKTPWVKKGAVWQRESDSTALLARQSATSFLADFDYSVNPLAGCPFSCDDCYVPALPAVKFRRDVLPSGLPTNIVAAWGSWVEVRTRSVEVLRRALDQGKLDGATLFMSPVSDVYWPGEREYLLTRTLLEEFVERPVFDWLLISTRSPLVCRDIDLLRRLGDRVEVGISIPSDREDVKAVFGRQNPSLTQRFQVAHDLVAAGIPTRIHVAPLQPHTPAFIERLADAAHWVWLDWHAHMEAGFSALFAAHGWCPSSPQDVATFAEQLHDRMHPARVRVGQTHFADRWEDVQRETQQLPSTVQI